MSYKYPARDVDTAQALMAGAKKGDIAAVGTWNNCPSQGCMQPVVGPGKNVPQGGMQLVVCPVKISLSSSPMTFGYFLKCLSLKRIGNATASSIPEKAKYALNMVFPVP